MFYQINGSDRGLIVSFWVFIGFIRFLFNEYLIKFEPDYVQRNEQENILGRHANPLNYLECFTSIAETLFYSNRNLICNLFGF